jgi:hypothetical protein
MSKHVILRSFDAMAVRNESRRDNFLMSIHHRAGKLPECG